jgi:hypothetical protein
MAKEDSVNWSDLKKILRDADKNELIDLIQDLYEQSTENREAIISRHMKGKKRDWVLENFLRIIRNELFPYKGLGGLRSDVTRKTVMDYSKGL